MGSLNRPMMHGQTARKITETMKLAGLENVPIEARDLIPTVRQAVSFCRRRQAGCCCSGQRTAEGLLLLTM